MKNKPNFLIAGVQKSGTTTLHHFLSSHPEIYFPPKPQEIHFFDNNEEYSKGIEHYYSRFSEADNSQQVGQTSPLYIYLPEAVDRIKMHLPNIKTIIILRHPVTRAYSHYWNSVRYGYEQLPFHEALQQESKRLLVSNQHRRNFSYVDRGFYSKQLDYFLSQFDKGNLLVLTQEQLINTTEQTLKTCCKFLEIDGQHFDNFKPPITTHNPSRLPRINSIQGIRPYLERYDLTLSVRLLDKLNLKNSSYPKISEPSKDYLNRTYKAEIESLRHWFLNFNGYFLPWT